MQDPGQTKGIISLILGIIGLISAWFWGIGTVFGIVAIIMAVMSGNASQAIGMKRSGLAIGGLVLGIISIVFGAGCLFCSLCYGASLCSTVGLTGLTSLADYSSYSQ